jgi:cold shock CspA family protein
LLGKHINRKGVHSLEKGQLASASIEEEFMRLIEGQSVCAFTKVEEVKHLKKINK